MKLGIFTDSHYSSAPLTCGKRRNNLSLGKISEALSLFKREGCDLVVSLGDLTDFESSHELEVAHLGEIGELIAKSGLPCICMMGNHDAFAFEKADFYRILGGYEPRNTVMDGKLLVFLDACFFKSGIHYSPGDSDWTDTFLPDEDALASLIASHGGEVILFIHQNIDPNTPADHRISNSDSVMRIIRESGKVKRVFQGHFHAGCTSEHDGVTYYTLPAVCENDNAYFIFDI